MPDTITAIALRPSILRRNWLPLKLAVREVLAFERRFGKKHLLLACHAALPSYLTAELLNLIHLNFLEEEDVPWIAEADFLLSPLCRPVDENLFEVEPAVREVLLVSLKRQYSNQQGEQRLVNLAAFLQKYLDEKSEQIQRPDVVNTLHWIARSYLQPDDVIEELRKQLNESLSTTEETNSTLIHQTGLVLLLEKIAEPLERSSLQHDYNYLIHDARVIAQQIYTDEEDSVDAGSIGTAHGSEGELATLVSPALLNWVTATAPSAQISTTASATQEREIETLLALAGWTIQDYAHANIRTAPGVAIRNFPLRPGTDETLDYLLFVEQQAAGVIFVMEEGQNRRGVEEATSLSRHTPRLRGEKTRRASLPFTYESNVQGTRIRFTNHLDPLPRTRTVFAFHSPGTLALWLLQAPPNASKSLTDLLRARLYRMPPLSHEELRDQQYEAISNLEKSLAENRPRALIQMISGSGKTYMIVKSIYRLLNFAHALRVLYLTDIDARAQYVYGAFLQERPAQAEDITIRFLPDTTPFSLEARVYLSTAESVSALLSREITLREYHTELASLSERWLASGSITVTSRRRVTDLLTKIQGMLLDIFEGDQLDNSTYLTTDERDRLRRLLAGNLELDRLTVEMLNDYVILLDDLLSYGINATIKTIQYNPTLPIDAFDIVVIDEYDSGTIDSSRALLEYFDAFLIGLTETEDRRILGFFNNNVVYVTPLITGGPFNKKIFISYSLRDARYLERFQTHLRPYLRNEQEILELWDTTRVLAGQRWEEEISKALANTKVALLLVSADFLASDYIMERELPSLLKAAEAGETTILLVILRPCDFFHSPLAVYQSINDPSVPLSAMKPPEQERVWERAAELIYNIMRRTEKG